MNEQLTEIRLHATRVTGTLARHLHLTYEAARFFEVLASSPAPLETDTGLQVNVQHHDERDGNDPQEMYLVLDGQGYELTKADAVRIASQLQAFAREMR